MASRHRTGRREFLIRTLHVSAGGVFSSQALSRTSLQAGDNKVDTWQIGCYTRPWDKQDYRVALDAIAEAGYKHAGLMTTNTKSRLVICAETSPEEAQQVGEEVKKRGLQVPSVYGGGIPVAKSL